jgi:hypothetical protein
MAWPLFVSVARLVVVDEDLQVGAAKPGAVSLAVAIRQ